MPWLPDPLPDERAVADASGEDLLACWAAAQVLRPGGGRGQARGRSP